MVAIARWVRRGEQQNGPQMYCLFPVVSDTPPNYSFRCVQLAFKEMVRPTKAFAPISTAGLSEEQRRAMRELMYKMRLPDPPWGLPEARPNGEGRNVLGGPSVMGRDMEPGCFPPNPTHQRHWEIVHNKAVGGGGVPLAWCAESLEAEHGMLEEAEEAMGRVRELFPMAIKSERQSKRERGQYGGGEKEEGKGSGGITSDATRKFDKVTRRHPKSSFSSLDGAGLRWIIYRCVPSVLDPRD